jgi:hypothetical protein
VKLAESVLLQMVIPESPQNLIGDNAYDSDKLQWEYLKVACRPLYGNECLLHRVQRKQAEEKYLLAHDYVHLGNLERALSLLSMTGVTIVCKTPCPR